jgi:hypothetical protein
MLDAETYTRRMRALATLIEAQNTQIVDVGIVARESAKIPATIEEIETCLRSKESDFRLVSLPKRPLGDPGRPNEYVTGKPYLTMSAKFSESGFTQITVNSESSAAVRRLIDLAKATCLGDRIISIVPKITFVGNVQDRVWQIIRDMKKDEHITQVVRDPCIPCIEQEVKNRPEMQRWEGFHIRFRGQRRYSSMAVELYKYEKDGPPSRSTMLKKRSSVEFSYDPDEPTMIDIPVDVEIALGEEYKIVLISRSETGETRHERRLRR